MDDKARSLLTEAARRLNSGPGDTKATLALIAEIEDFIAIDPSPSSGESQ